MNDFAVLTEEVANGLSARGFKLKDYTVGKYTNVWTFEDSVSLQRAVSELVEGLQEEDK